MAMNEHQAKDAHYQRQMAQENGQLLNGLSHQQTNPTVRQSLQMKYDKALHDIQLAQNALAALPHYILEMDINDFYRLIGV